MRGSTLAVYHGSPTHDESEVPMGFEITNVETVHAGRSKFLLLTVRLPDGEPIRRAVEDHRPAEPEDTAALELSMKELTAMTYKGTLDDMKPALLVQTLRLRRPDLFA